MDIAINLIYSRLAQLDKDLMAAAVREWVGGDAEGTPEWAAPLLRERQALIEAEDTVSYWQSVSDQEDATERAA